MITSVRIGNIDFAVLLAHHDLKDEDTERDGQVLGEIQYAKAEIYIEEDGQSEQIRKQTLVHEILHGIVQQCGLYEAVPEHVIVALGYNFTALIQQNPHLIEYLTEEICPKKKKHKRSTKR